MKCNRQLFCHLGSFFAFYPTPPFPPPPNNPKNEDIKKMRKKSLDISFYKSVPKIMICYTVPIVSSPLKLGVFLVFEILTKRGVMKTLLRNRGLVERERDPLRNREVSILFHQFSFRKACFHYHWHFFCLVNIHTCCNQ